MLSVVWAELTPGIVQAIVPPRIQPAPRGTVRRSKVGKAPRLEAEQQHEVGVQNGAWGVICRLIHEACLGSLHEVCPLLSGCRSGRGEVLDEPDRVVGLVDGDKVEPGAAYLTGRVFGEDRNPAQPAGGVAEFQDQPFGRERVHQGRDVIARAAAGPLVGQAPDFLDGPADLRDRFQAQCGPGEDQAAKLSQAAEDLAVVAVVEGDVSLDLSRLGSGRASATACSTAWKIWSGV